MCESQFFNALALISAFFHLSVSYNAPYDSPLALLRAASCGTLSEATGHLHILPHRIPLEIRTKSHENNL